MQTLLWPLSVVYAAATRFRNFYYDRVPGATHDAGIPVISVGNMTTGGTGKTPLVIEIVARLRALHRKPAIVSRGYRGTSSQAADEVLEFAQALPDVLVVVDSNRVRAALEVRRERGGDCVVLDDGFQHRRLRRNLDIVVVDALDPLGGGHVLPAGRLREPRTGIGRADLVVISRCNLVAPEDEQRVENDIKGFQRYGYHGPVVKANTVPTDLTDLDDGVHPVNELAGRRVLPVCGIGNPESFLRLLRSVGADLCDPLMYRDHHRYQSSDLSDIRRRAERANAEWVVTTRKDWVKLAPLASGSWDGPDLLRLNMRMELVDPDDTVNTLLRQAVESAAL